MTPATTVFVSDTASTVSSHTEQERERLRRELLRRIINSELRRQAVRIAPR